MFIVGLVIPRSARQPRGDRQSDRRKFEGDGLKVQRKRTTHCYIRVFTAAYECVSYLYLYSCAIMNESINITFERCLVC